MRTVKANYKATYESIADLATYRAIPTEHLPMNQLDPFIFLNHHGWQQYAPGNSGLPFGPHPHRGFETVTFILDGDLMHKDSSGASEIIYKDGVQWMTAGSGLVHAEISSEAFKKDGGPLEILQLWVNLPSHLKMVQPQYNGWQKEAIPAASFDDGKVIAQVISGEFEGTQGAKQALTDIILTRIDLEAAGKITISVDPQKTILFYVARGQVKVNGEMAEIHHVVEFNHDGKVIEIKAVEKTILLLGYATPFHEPFVAYGPFVMNTQQEIMEAYEDYNNGKFGVKA